MTKILPTSRLYIFSFFLLLAIQAWQASAENLLLGNHSFHYEFEQDRSIQIWYYKPEGFTKNSQILFVMHGNRRNAIDYRNEWIRYADNHSALIIAPEFSEETFPGTQFYHLGNVVDSKQAIQPFEKTAYHLIDQLFLKIKAITQSQQQQYDIYGHSAGAQFVHRLVLFGNLSRIRIAIAANSGWYTAPSNTIVFPYGLKGSPLKEEHLAPIFETRLVVLLGKKDNNENHRYLRKTIEAMQQGQHRLARGKYFYQSGKKQAERLNAVFKWQQVFVTDAGHSNRLMSAAAQAYFSSAKP